MTRPSSWRFAAAMRHETLLVGLNRGEAPYQLEGAARRRRNVASQVFTASGEVDQVSLEPARRTDDRYRAGGRRRRAAGAIVEVNWRAYQRGESFAADSQRLHDHPSIVHCTSTGWQSRSFVCFLRLCDARFAHRHHDLASVAAGRKEFLEGRDRALRDKRIRRFTFAHSTKKPKSFAADFRRRRLRAAGRS